MAQVWFNRLGDLDRQVFTVQGDRVRIGSATDNDVVLASPTIAEKAAILSRSGTQWEVLVMGRNGLRVGNYQLQQGERAAISVHDEILIFPFQINLEETDTTSGGSVGSRAEFEADASQWILELHAELLKKRELDAKSRDDETLLLELERDIEEIARLQKLQAGGRDQLLTYLAACSVQSYLLDSILHSAGSSRDPWQHTGRWNRLYTAAPDLEEELRTLGRQVAEKLRLVEAPEITVKIELLEAGYWDVWDGIATGLYANVRDYLALRYLKKQIKDLVFGYGPLEDLLRLPNINEIMVVDSGRIYVEKNNRLEKSGRRFASDAVTLNIIERIVSRVGREINKSRPMVDARLMDGSRVNAIIPPLAVSGPCLTIRKFPNKSWKIEDLLERKSLTPTVAGFLRAAVLAHKNVIISGGTGTGKTTMLNCLSNFIPDHERIVTVEDTAELQLQKEHVVRLETRAANVENEGRIEIRDLVKNALRMRPDRIIVGECRGAEALDMLQAMNTGHDGSMTTLHANTSADVILRLEVLVQMTKEIQLPIQAIHRQIASAVDLVIQLGRVKGRRVVTQVTEFAGYDETDKQIRLKDLFLLEGPQNAEELVPTGVLPSFIVELIESGFLEIETFYL